MPSRNVLLSRTVRGPATSDDYGTLKCLKSNTFPTKLKQICYTYAETQYSTSKIIFKSLNQSGSERARGTVRRVDASLQFMRLTQTCSEKVRRCRCIVGRFNFMSTVINFRTDAFGIQITSLTFEFLLTFFLTL